MTKLKIPTEVGEKGGYSYRDPSFTELIDFSNKSGTTKITKVSQIIKNREYSPYMDYYKPLRDFIIGNLIGEIDNSRLTELLNSVSNTGKKENFKLVMKGFNKFKKSNDLEFFKPPFSYWEPSNELRVRVNPEVGIILNGKPTILKLHFNCKKESVLKASSAKCMIRLMQNSFYEFSEDYEFGIWDVRRSKVFYLSESDDLITIDGFLLGEAQSFINIRNSLLLRDSLIKQVA